MKNVTNILFLLVSISVFSQSPWVKEKGRAYTQLSFSTIPYYNNIFGDPDNYVLNGEISDNTLQFYGEYGLTSKTTLLLNLPFKKISLKNYQDSTINCSDCSESALGNIEIGVKHNFYDKNWLLSGQISVEANTNSYDTNSGIRTGYDAYSFTPLLLGGKGFDKYYFQSFLGARIKTNGYSSNIKFGGEFGYKLSNKIWAIAFLDIEKTLENGDIDLPVANLNTALYVNDQEFGVLGLKVIGELSDNFGLTTSLPMAAFFANNLPQQLALTVGIYGKF